MNINTVDPKFVGDIRAAADFIGPGAFEVNRYQDEIFDLVRRRFPFGQRIQQTPATGHPSRYVEQVAIPEAAFTDPRVINPTPSQPERQERSLPLKAIAAKLSYSIFDIEVTQQQQNFAYLEGKDLSDLIEGLLKLHDKALWVGTDTSMMLPTTNQYYGLSGQIARGQQFGGISNHFPIADTASIIDGLKTAVATMYSREDFECQPSAIYFNPLFGDKIDQEAKTVQMYFNETEVIPGVIVKSLPTQAGLLPLVGDPSITLNNAPGNKKLYSAFIVQEDSIEYHWLTSPVPRVFQLGLLANLAATFVVVKFGAVVAKGPGYAHSIATYVK